MKSVGPGDVLAGKYRVERVLGQGGMGYVVAARHLQLDQLVAIKFLRRGALDEGEATMRFQREAKASVRLRNEHVARVFDVGTLESGEPYMVMEYLEGCDLSALSKQRGAISPGEAVEYVLQSCEALAEAHSYGIVHRDIKLANLFITHGPGGTPIVKVLDFGISKTNPFGASEHEMTRTSAMLGSPRFMSPEQMRDPRAVDARSDIWSLGVVLFRLVGGKAPFEAETLGQLLSMVMHETPTALSSLRNDLPPHFEAAVLRCLEKDPTRRYANVAELAYAIAPYAIDPGRAHATADRIAATLSVAQIPPSAHSFPRSDLPSSSRRNSGPPGSIDTGTAAWGHTRASTAQARQPLVWALAATFALAAAGVIVFAKTRHDASESRAAAAANGPIAPTTEVAPPVEPPPAVPVAVPAPPTTSNLIGASPEPSAPIAKAAEEPKKRATTVAPPRGRSGGGVARPQAAAAAAPKDENGGIPATRD